MKKYSIISVPDQFRRSGILFSHKPTILTEEEITKDILNELALKVTEIKEQVKESKKPKKSKR